MTDSIHQQRPDYFNYLGSLLDIPFEHNGRARSGADCYGLLCIIFDEFLHIELPHYTYSNNYQKRISLEYERDQRWDLVINPVRFDTVVMRIVGDPVHVGVMVDDLRFIHMSSRYGVLMQQISDPRINSRIEGFYRYAG